MIARAEWSTKWPRGDLLREVLAKDCRLEMINTNINRQFGQQQEGFNVNGSMNLQVTLK